VVGGYTHLHSELERRLAALTATEECLLCPTGFAANMAVLTALCSDADAAVFSDELNHASIIDGARLAARNKVRPPHAAWQTESPP
jgi:8-amino-7-oxononanoate synthase